MVERHSSIENARNLMADEYDRVQKKTFTKWVNTHLMKAGMKVNDLFEDFSDGVKLITLLELFTKDKLPRERGKMRIHKRQNVQVALECLQRHKVKLVGITSDHIVDGNKKLILGLVWTLILRFQLSKADNVDQRAVKEELLQWAKQAVDPYDLPMANFSSHWSDGRAFCAILNRHRPDLLDYNAEVDPKQPMDNLNLAFDVAYNELGVEKLLDTEDVCVANPDEKSILTYVSFIKNQFPTMPPPPNLGATIEDYQPVYEDLHKWATHKLVWVKGRDFPSTLEEMREKQGEFQTYITKEYPAKSQEKAQLAEMAKVIESRKGSQPLPADLSMERLNTLWAGLKTENESCKMSIESEIERMEKMVSLAAEVEDTCAKEDKQMNKIEEKMDKFEGDLTKLSSESVNQKLEQLKSQIQDLEDPVSRVKHNLGLLEAGKYWDFHKVKPKVDDTAGRYDALKARLSQLSDNARQTGAVQERLSDLHKRFQEVVKWKAGEDFVKTFNEKKKFLDDANSEFELVSSDPATASVLSDSLVAQRDAANKHWEELCKSQEAEDKAQKTLGEMQELHQTVNEWSGELDMQKPLADTLAGVKKQQEVHKEFMAKLNAKKPEVMQYGSVSVKCQSKDLLAAVKQEHTALGKAWIGLNQSAAKWGKLLYSCEAAWDGCEALERDLCGVEKWLAARGHPKDSQLIIVQHSEMQSFQTEQVNQLEARVKEVDTLCSQLKSLGGHPPVEELNSSVSKRYRWLTGSVEERLKALSTSCSLVQQFEEVQQPLQGWVTEATTHVKGLFPLEIDREKLNESKERLERIQEEANGEKPRVDRMIDLTAAFEDSREPIIKEGVSYRSKLESMSPCPINLSELEMEPEDSGADVASIEDHGLALRSRWQWILDQSIEGMEIVSNFTRQLEDFEVKHLEMQKFLEDGRDRLAEEKPVASTSGQIKAQLENCTAFMKMIDGKQPFIDAMLTGGRSMLSSKHSAANNESFEQKLTSFIEDWSSCQLAWEDWYRELQAATDKSSAAGAKFSSFANWLSEAKTKMDSSFPVKPGQGSVSEMFQSALSEFDVEVKDPCEQQQSTADDLREEIPLLDEPNEAEDILQEYGRFTLDIQKKRGKMVKAFDWSKMYDEQMTAAHQAMETWERKLAEEKPIPSSQDAIDLLAKELADLQRDVSEKTPSIEAHLALLGSTDEFSDVVDISGFVKERSGLEKRWNRIKLEIESRPQQVEKSRDQFQNYESSVGPFGKWLSAAERDRARLKKVPKNKRKMKKFKDSLDKFKADVDDHEGDLQVVKQNRDEFVETCQEHDQGCGNYRDFLTETNPAILEPVHSSGTPKKVITPDVGADVVAKETDQLVDRYEALKAGTAQRKCVFDEANSQREPVDSVIEELVPLLEQLEAKCQPLLSEEKDKTEPNEILEDAKLADSCQNECAVLAPKLEVLNSAALNWFTTRDQDKGDSIDGEGEESSEDEDDVAKDKDNLEERLKKLKDMLDSKKSKLDSLLSSTSQLYSDLADMEAWLAPVEKRRADMDPAAVRSTPLQQQLREAEEFAKSVADYQPQMDKVSEAVEKIQAGPKAEDSQPPPILLKYQDCLDRFEKLKFDISNRLEMLTEFEPRVEEMEVGLKSCDDQVTEWEAQAEEIKAMNSANIENLRQQASDIQKLKDAIVAMENGRWADTQDKASTLMSSTVGPFGEEITAPSSANGAAGTTQPNSSPSSKKKKKSKKKKSKKTSTGSTSSDSRPSPTSLSNSGMDVTRPGKEDLVKDIDDVNERIEQLKQLVAQKEKEVADKLRKAEDFLDLKDDLEKWLAVKEKEVEDALPVKDVTSSALQKQGEQLQKLKDELASREKDKEQLKGLLEDLTAQLPPDSPDKEELAGPFDSLSQRWEDLNRKLDEQQPKVEELEKAANTHEPDCEAVTKWLTSSEPLIVDLLSVPSDSDAVQQKAKNLEALERDLAQQEPLYTSCCGAGKVLSEGCDDAVAKEGMEKKLSDLEDQWEQMKEKVRQAKDKLSRAAAQGEQFDNLVGKVLDWINSTSRRLNDQEPVAVKTPLIEEQIKQQQALLEEVNAKGPEIKQAQQVGQDMLKDLEGKELEKLDARLKGLTTKYTDLDDILYHRKEQLDEAKEKAGTFEGQSSNLDDWLDEKEPILASFEVLPVDSAALESLMDRIGEFDQQVTDHFSSVVDFVKSEESLLGCDLESISPFEKGRPHSGDGAQKVKFAEAKKQKSLPMFMRRPGASDVVDEACELRGRYEDLKKTSTAKLNEVSDLLTKVQKYETDLGDVSIWLNEKKRDILSLGPVPATPEEVQREVDKLQALQDEFADKEPMLELVNELGGDLIGYSGPTTSSEAVKAKLDDTNKLWDDLLALLDKREEDLSIGGEQAKDYQEKSEDFLKWLKGVEEKLEEPEKTSGDPLSITRQLAETNGLSLDITDHKPDLEDIVKMAQKLREGSGKKELGDKDIVERFKNVENKTKERSDSLEATLEKVKKADRDLSNLLKTLEDINTPLSSHAPVRVTSADISDQLANLKNLEQRYSVVQPDVVEVLELAEVFAVPGEGERDDVTSTGSSALSDHLEQSKVSKKKGKSSKKAASKKPPSPSMGGHKRSSGELGRTTSPRTGRKESAEGKGQPRKSGKGITSPSPSPSHQLVSVTDGDKSSPESSIVEMTPSIPSGGFLQQQVQRLKDLNENTKVLLDGWEKKATDGLNLANRFENEYDSLYKWVENVKEKVEGLGPVQLTEDKIKEQLATIKALQEQLDAKRQDLEHVNKLGGELQEGAVPTDVEYIQEKLENLNSSFDGLSNALQNQKTSLLEGLNLCAAYEVAKQQTEDAIAEKRANVSNLPSVGMDIETVQSQLEDCKALEELVNGLKNDLSTTQEQGKKLMAVVGDADASQVDGELQNLSAKWNELNGSVFARKHELEDALLKLGKFHDALAELLLWVSNEMADLVNPVPPGVEEDTIMKKMADLQELKTEIEARTPSVASVRDAAGQLISSSSSGDTSDLRADIKDFNSKWEELNRRCEARDKELNNALEKAKRFHGNRKKEIDWLDDTEKVIGLDDKVHGLPESCAKDIKSLEALIEEVKAHAPPVEALKSEGEGLKPQGDSQEQQQVDNWVRAVRQRYEDLLAGLGDRGQQLDVAKTQAEEFDLMYNDVLSWLNEKELEQEREEPIHSELEAVKKQLEDHKTFQKDLDDSEHRVDEVVGCGQLLCRQCVPEDAEVVQKKLEELQAKWDIVNAEGSERQSKLEEALLALGQFEEAYDELMKWLTDAEDQLDNPESITGDPDAVGTLRNKHKAFQKQLGARNSSLNSVLKAGNLLKKQKEGEDEALVKAKLDDIEKKWDEVCQKSVSRQDKLQEAYRKLGEFRVLLSPLRTWLGKTLAQLDENAPVHGDVATVRQLITEHKALEKELVGQEKKYEAIKECAKDLIDNYLDEPLETQKEVDELVALWDEVRALAASKQERLKGALKDAKSFQSQYDGLMQWMDENLDHLSDPAPPSDNPNKLDKQIQDQKDFVASIHSKQPELEKALECGRDILEMAHPRASPVVQAMMHDLDLKWSKLKTTAGKRSEELSGALLEMKGLQDMLDKLTNWVGEAETWINEKEQEPVGEELDVIEQQLAEHEAFQDQMANHQPDMDALSKAEKGHKQGKGKNDLDKKIRSLHKRWQKLWMRMSDRHRHLLEGKTRTKDVAMARSFDFEAWRKRFNVWVDRNKLRLNELFRRADSNHDGNLTKEELIKALRASGLPSNPVELNKVALVLDREHIGVYNIQKVIEILRPEKAAPKKEPKTDSEKIAVEIERQIAQCTCPKRYQVQKISEGKYRFGDSQQLRLVRILRSTVMVRVGGGWDPLDVFLRKHDPCRADSRTNVALGKGTPGLGMAGFTTKSNTQIKTKNEAQIGNGTTVRQLPSGRLEASRSKDAATPTKPGLYKANVGSTAPGSAARPNARAQGPPPSSSATPKKHALPRQSPRREVGEGNIGAVSQSELKTPTYRSAKTKRSVGVEVSASQDGTVKGKITSTKETSIQEGGQVAKATTFRASKSPSPNAGEPGGKGRVATPTGRGTPTTKSSPTPKGSRLPTPSKVSTTGSKTKVNNRQ